MPQSDYTFGYNIAIFIVGTLSCLYVYFTRPWNKLLQPVIPSVTFMLCAFLVFSIALFPIQAGTDKGRYAEMFKHAYSLNFSKDIGWQYYLFACKHLFNSTFLFFLLSSFIYVSGYYKFSATYLPRPYIYYFLLLVFGSLGFFSYGVNTIRAGIGLSITLLAISNRNKKLYFVLLACLAVSIHKSMLLILLAFIVTRYYKRTNTYLALWLIMLIVSFLNIPYISDFIQSNFSNVDERVSEYMNAVENDFYQKTGFRYDFIIYSLYPILIGYYYIYIKKFRDPFYNQIYHVYLIINFFWLLVIRIPFTDRFAYLSWFLMPVILLYPLFFQKIFAYQHRKVALLIFSMLFINFILNVLR